MQAYTRTRHLIRETIALRRPYTEICIYGIELRTHILSSNLRECLRADKWNG